MDRKVILLVIITIIIICIIIGIYIWNKVSNDQHLQEYELSFRYWVSIVLNEIKNFITKESLDKLDFEHILSDYSRVYKYSSVPQPKRGNLPFAGSCVLDHLYTDNDKELVFVGMGKDQDDILLEYDPSQKKLVNKINGSGLSSKEATLATASYDMNNNGKTDIIIARLSGVYIYINNGNLNFTKHLIYGPFKDSEPTAISIGDYNNNELPDIYISRFTPSAKLKPYKFNDKDHYRTNILLENKGNLTFEDVTEKTNSAGHQNTFTSVFIDFGSGYPDLLLAHDTGKVELLKNNKGIFTPINLDIPYGFWMGIAVGDYNNNGKLDLFFTNVGNTLPISKSGGIKGNPKTGGILPGQNLTNKHLLLENMGDYKFRDISDKANVADYGFAWGAIMEDINLDGKLDIIFAQNYIDYPHPTLLNGVVLLNQHNNIFKRVDALQNKYHGQTPIAVDLTGNGIKDIVWINMNGLIHGYIINKKDKNYVSIRLPDKPEFLNSTIYIHTKDNVQMRQNIIGGIGFGGDQSHIHMFGLGKTDKVDKIIIKTIRKKEYIMNDPPINRLITFRDNKFTYDTVI